MAMQLPCVTTTMVNNAIGAEPGKEILIADDLEGLVNQIRQLLEDPDLYHRIAVAARNFVVKNYSWEEQVQKLDAFICSENVYST